MKFKRISNEIKHHIKCVNNIRIIEVPTYIII